MRIGMLSWESLHSISVGGVAAHVSELAAALQRAGHEVHIFTRRRPGQSAYDRVYGVHYHRCQYPAHSDFVEDVNNMCRAIVDRFFEVEDFVGHFDLVHAHDWLAANAMIWVKKGRGHRCIFTVHSTEYGRSGNAFLGGRSIRIRAQERAGTYWADHVIAVSNTTKKEIQWMYEVPEGKVSAIYNGVSPHRFDGEIDSGCVKRLYVIGPVDPTVLFCGRLAWQKGPDLLVEAAPSVLKYYPRAKFVFVGEGEMRYPLEARVRQLGLSQAVRFLGVRGGEELVRLFKSAEVVCVPSRNEPFGIVVLEAWSAGKPVVVTENGGPNEFVQHDYSGLKIQPKPDSIAWGLGTMFMNFDRARWMGENGRREVEQRFTWDTICGQTLGVYEAAAPQASEAGPDAAPAQEQSLAGAEAANDAAAEPAPVAEPEAAAEASGAFGESLQPADGGEELVEASASLPATELADLSTAGTAHREEPSLQIHVSAKLSWKPRSAGDSVTDVFAACKRILGESGLRVTYHGRAARVEGRWDHVLEAINRCFRLVDQTGQSQIVATIMPPAAPLGSPHELDEPMLVPDKTPTESMMVKNLVALV
jgi:glycosyltransferase involved in cell wall biosynthesis/uncharacterized protein YqgV (UPF0045/DUF77 family)